MPAISPEQVYTEYSGKVMGYIRARIRSGADAEDLHSEVFEKILRKLDVVFAGCRFILDQDHRRPPS